MRFWKFCTFSVACFALAGCSTQTLFTSYPDKMSANLTQVNQGQYQQCITNLTAAQKSNDYELYAAELGRIQQLANNYSASTDTFMPLMTRVEADQLAAKIRGSRVLVNTGSLFTNDNVIPYKLSSFEIVYLYQYQALNFIAQGDIQNALVAARKANNMQIYLAQEYQKELVEAQTEAKKDDLNFDFINDQTNQLQTTLQASASVKDSFANAMSYYLSGLLFLATNDLNDAAVAFQQAVSIMPNNTYLQNMLLITMQMQGAPKTNITNYQKAFGMKALPAIPQNKAYVTVMYEQNFVSPRIPISIPISMPSMNQMQPFSFPAYPTPALPISPLNVSMTLNNQLAPLSDTELMVNTNALAAKDLMQQYPLIFMREALRFLTKMGMVNAAQNSSNDQNMNNLAATLMQVYSVLSDRPDLRSWLTLPQDIQIGQYTLSPGNYVFHFSNNNLGTDLPQTLKANQYYLLWVTQYGREIKVQAFQL